MVRTFQTFDDNADRKDPKLVRVLHGTLNQHADELRYLNSKGAGVFVVVNDTDGKGRKAENIIRVRAVFADLDGAPLDPVLQHYLPPHVVVETSPDHFHCYWRVTGLPLELFSGVQKAIAARFNSDPVVCDLPRVMRVPGFWHRKGTPFMSRLIRDVPGICENITSHFPPMPDEPHTSSPKKGANALDLWLVSEALKVIPNDDVHWLIWNQIGMATYRATDGDEFGKEAFIAWSMKSPKHNALGVEKKWERYCKSPPTKLGIGTLIFLAKLAEPGWYERVMYELMEIGEQTS
jgi:hypothetical protein